MSAIVREISMCSSARAHQHANGVPLAECGRRKKGTLHPEDAALGRSRGGLTTMFHVACDGKGHPFLVLITAGHRHDSTHIKPFLNGIWVPRFKGRRRPCKRPDRVIAVKGYSYERCRRRRGIGPYHPDQRDQRAHHAATPRRPLAFDAVT